jgi:hypothetical protein
VEAAVEAVEAAAKVEMVLGLQGSQVLRGVREELAGLLAGLMLLGASCFRAQPPSTVQQLPQPALVAAVGKVLNDPERAKS